MIEWGVDVYVLLGDEIRVVEVVCVMVDVGFVVVFYGLYFCVGV